LESSLLRREVQDSHGNNTYDILVAIRDQAGKAGIKCGDFPALLQSSGYQQGICDLAESLDARDKIDRQCMH